MTVLQAFILGALQGITEFLPVSSSGHLIIAEQFMRLTIDPKDMLGFNVFLHAGTLAALLIIYARFWMRVLLAPFRNDHTHRELLLFLIIATVPGAVAGYVLEDTIVQTLQTLPIVAFAFAGTGFILLLGENIPRRLRSVARRLLQSDVEHAGSLNARAAFFIGLAQGIALIPGLSRSGLTISAGRIANLDRSDALDFSFQMLVPIIAGATLLSLNDVARGDLLLPPLHIIFVAVFSSCMFSAMTVLLLRALCARFSLAWFSPYLFAIAAVTIALFLAQ